MEQQLTARELVAYFTIYGYNIRKGLTCYKHTSPAGCLTKRLARIISYKK